MPKAKAINHSVFKTPSPRMAYLLGLFWADGFAADDGRLALTSIDRSLLVQVRHLFGSEHAITRRQPKHKRNVFYVWQGRSRQAVEDLKRWGYRNHPPTSLPERYHGHFLRGLFDGDGTIGFNRHPNRLCWQVGFLSKEPLTSWLADMFGSAGLPQWQPTRYGAGLNRHTFSAAGHVIFLFRWMYEYQYGHGVYVPWRLERKFLLFQKALNSYRGQRGLRRFVPTIARDRGQSSRTRIFVRP